MVTQTFAELGLSKELLQAIDKLGFEKPAPIQAAAIPLLLAGRDVVGQSQTGSGKTVAFVAPALDRLAPQERAIQVLILCPTRELAIQVCEEVHKLAAFKQDVHALPIYGGQSYERQFYGLKQGPQIVIGTPGRIMDHMRRGTLRLDQLRNLILDEADVMLDMGFREDIEFILKATPAERQTVFFSATMPRPIQELIRNYSRDPQTVQIEQKSVTVPTVEQVYYEVDRRFKLELLTRLIDLHDFRTGIIFCNTKRMVDDLVEHLNAQGCSADRLHGDMSQALRDRVMSKFRAADVEFLVATDVAARGIDVQDVQVVFNYDLPYDVEDYVHRVGRTGRAGREGKAISFAAGRELFQIQHIQRYTKTKIQRGVPPTPDQVEEARAALFLEKLRTTLNSATLKRDNPLITRLLDEGFTAHDVASALLHHLQGDAAAASGAPRQEQVARSERDTVGHRREARQSDRRERTPQAQRERPRLTRAEWEFRLHDERATRPRAERRSPREPLARSRQDVQRKERPVEPPKKFRFAKRQAVELSPAPKPSRRTPAEQTKIFLNVGSEMGVGSGDVVGAILGETGLPAQVVGRVDVRDRHVFVDVASDHANSIVSKLNRAQIKGKKIKAKVA